MRMIDAVCLSIIESLTCAMSQCYGLRGLFWLHILQCAFEYGVEKATVERYFDLLSYKILPVLVASALHSDENLPFHA